MALMKLMLLLLLLCSPDLLAADFFSEPAYLSRLKKKQTGTPPEPPASWTPSNLTAIVNWWSADKSITNASGLVTNMTDIIGGYHLTNPISGRIPIMLYEGTNKLVGFGTTTNYLRNQNFAEALAHSSCIYILKMTNRSSVQNFMQCTLGGMSRKSTTVGNATLQIATGTVISGFRRTNFFCIFSHVKWYDTAWRESWMTNNVIGSTVSGTAGWTNIWFMNGTAGNIGMNGALADIIFLRTNANAAAMAGDMSNLYVWATNKYGVF